MLGAIDEVEQLLVELAALPSCEGQDVRCQARQAPRLAGRIANLLKPLGAYRTGVQVMQEGRLKRGSLSRWIKSGGWPT